MSRFVFARLIHFLLLKKLPFSDDNKTLSRRFDRTVLEVFCDLFAFEEGESSCLEKILQTVDFFNRVFFGSVWTGKNDLKTLRVDANGRKIAPFSKISGYVWTGT